MNSIDFNFLPKGRIFPIQWSLQVVASRQRDFSVIRDILVGHSNSLKLTGIAASERINVHNLVYYLTHPWSTAKIVSLKFDKEVRVLDLQIAFN